MMEHSPSLARLEEFVDTLLNQHTQLKAENLALQHGLQERDNAIRELQQEVERLIGERQEIGDRVTRLLGRIERWQDERSLSEPAGQDQASSRLLAGESD